MEEETNRHQFTYKGCSTSIKFDKGFYIVPEIDNRFMRLKEAEEAFKVYKEKQVLKDYKKQLSKFKHDTKNFKQKSIRQRCLLFRKAKEEFEAWHNKT